MVDVLKSLCIFLVISTICTQLISNKGFYKYVQLLVGLMMLSIVLQDIRFFLNGAEGTYMNKARWQWLMDMEKELDQVEQNQLVEFYMQDVSGMFEEVETEDASETLPNTSE